uniref:GLUG motif-containing protein n=1 Tax=Prevotella sp. TaxID=59823 RepID=UPI004027B09C
MNNKRQRNRLFTMLLLVMAILMPYGGAWAQETSRPLVGNGSTGNPYIITKAEELEWFRDQVNSGQYSICAKIADNVEVIDMSTVCHAADKSQNLEEKSWVPIGNRNIIKYRGTFDGNGKTITNLYINASQTSQNNMGLFGYTYQSTIKNLTFENANVTNTQSNTGILVGKAGYGSTLQNIKISKTCQIKGGNYTGGIAGELDGNAYNCVNYATVQGIKYVGGFLGMYSRKGNSITACANYGNVTASSEMAGGLVGYFRGGTIQDCANYGDVKGTNRVAGMAGFVSDGKVQNVFSYGNISVTNKTQNVGMVFGCSVSGATEGMVAYYSGAKLIVNGKEKEVKAFGNGTPSEDNATGFTKDQLKSGFVAYQLQQNASSEAKWGQNLANDDDIYPVIGSEHQVYADNTTLNCKTYEVVRGSFTNNPTSSAIRYQHGTIIHHVATDATCTEAATKEYWQCQDCLKTYSDSQLTKELTDVTDAEHPALGHDNNEDGYCKRCQHYVAVKPSEENGVYLIAKPCHLAWFRDYVNGTIVDEGGVAGTTHPSASAMLTADIDLKNYCHAAEDGKELLSWIPIGYVNNSWSGNMDGQGHTISHLYIKTAQNFVGLFGYTYGATIQDLIFDYAKVENVSTTNTKTAYTGILAGYAYGALSHIKGIKTTNNCTVIGQQITGGIVGYAKINLENCDNHSSVKGTDNVGGIAGSSIERNIRRSTNYGTVENNNTSIGGIIGYAYGTSIEDCANYGKISSTGWYTGGIAGQTEANCSIQNVFSYGDVTNTNEVPGIIIGYVEGTLTAKGIVAYNKEALLNNSSENFKKVVGRGSLTFEDGKEEADVVKAFTQQQIKSGEVAWLLNGSTSAPAEGSTLAWYQKLGDNADAYPVLKSTGDNTVYQAPLISCDGTTPIGEYANNPNGDQLSHNYQMATVADANGLYGGVCVECNSPEEGVKYIKDFCGILGNNLKLIYADGKYTAEAVTLTDGEAYNSPVDIEVADFKYIRTFDAYKWQSLYVPFRMSLEQLTSNGLNVATPVDIEVVNETITRLNVQKLKSGSTKANYPSLIMCESDGEKTIELADVTLSASKEKFIDCMSMTRKYVFNGVYQANKNLASNSEDAINYIIKDGGLVLRTDDDVPAPQSWYMNVTIRESPFGGADEPLSSDAKTMPIYVIGEGYATGIENVNTAEEHIQQGIYDLQGRKLSQEPESGIYIKDGKKYVK